MNYYQARELKGDDGQGTGRWRFTVRNDDRIWATGYCADPADLGHDTAEDAEHHYYAYELDTAQEVSIAGQQRPCAVCGAWTQQGYGVGAGLMETVLLCDEHRNRDGLEQARPFAPGRQIISSY